MIIAKVITRIVIRYETSGAIKKRFTYLWEKIIHARFGSNEV